MIFDIFGDNSAVALYELDDNATDTGGNYDGTWSGTESYDVGVIGNAAKFDGSSCIKNNDFTAFEEFSISLFVNYANSPVNWGRVIDFMDGTNTSSRLNIAQNSSNTGEIVVQGHDGSNKVFDSSDDGISYQLSDSTLSHIVLMYDGATVKWYVDNNQIYSKSVSSLGNLTRNKFRIGATDWDNDTAGNFWKGLIDQVRIFNRALTDDEVNTLYNEVNGDIVVTTSTIDLTTTVNSPTIPNVSIIKIKPPALDLTANLIDLKYFGGRWDNYIIPYTTKLNIFANYLPIPTSNIVSLNTINLNFDIGKYLNNNVRVFANSINLTTFTYFLYNFDKKPRVAKINDIVIKPNMYFTNNRTKFLTSSKMYINGKTKLFKSPLYTSKEVITTDNDFALDYHTVKKIYDLLKNTFDITLSNGEVLSARFDLSNSPFQADRIYKGGIGFYLTLRVLI